MRQNIIDIVNDSLLVKSKILLDQNLLANIEKAAEKITTAFKDKKKVLLCGNGGSAADAQHIAAEFSGRFYFDRPPLFAEALHVNSSFMTAVANDYEFDVVYSRMIQAAGEEGDILMAFSTSGNSKSILNAIDMAKEKGMFVIGFTGESGGMMGQKCDCLLNMPSKITPRIQESHIMVGHIICEFVEKNIFDKK